jgi:protein-S-isoprenylcysteine O-methyltransferase Ste14
VIRPLAFTWPWAPFFWIAFIWAFAPEFGVVRKASTKSDKDAGSLIVILVGNQVAMFLGFLSTWVFKRAAMPYPFVLYWVGIAVLIAGSLLRRYCFRILGRFFDGAVNIQSDHRVIDFGPYRWVRHPAYTGGMLMFLGIAIALGNWVSVAVLVVLPVFAYSYRVRVEERALVESLGEPYAAYMRTHKRFVPFVI